MKSRLLTVVMTVCIGLGVAATALSLFFRLYSMPTASMEPTIHVGERFIMRRTTQVSRGDIIVFDYPLSPNTQFAKRLVALGGDRVEIRDKQLYVNGTMLNEPYAIHEDPMIYPRRGPTEIPLPEPFRSRDQFGPFIVPPGTYFVLGDNRDRSSDSRYWGTVPQRLVHGVVVMVGRRRI